MEAYLASHPEAATRWRIALRCSGARGRAATDGGGLGSDGARDPARASTSRAPWCSGAAAVVRRTVCMAAAARGVALAWWCCRATRRHTGCRGSAAGTARPRAPPGATRRRRAVDRAAGVAHGADDGAATSPRPGRSGSPSTIPLRATVLGDITSDERTASSTRSTVRQRGDASSRHARRRTLEAFQTGRSSETTRRTRVASIDPFQAPIRAIDPMADERPDEAIEAIEPLPAEYRAGSGGRHDEVARSESSGRVPLLVGRVGGRRPAGRPAGDRQPARNGDMRPVTKPARCPRERGASESAPCGLVSDRAAHPRRRHAARLFPVLVRSTTA